MKRYRLRWGRTAERALERPFNQGVPGSSPGRLTRIYKDLGETTSRSDGSCVISCVIRGAVCTRSVLAISFLRCSGDR
jgi:hypothetical protein